LKYDDFRADLQRDEYVVVKGAIPGKLADHYRQKALDWMLSFGSDLDLDKRETWVEENLLVMNKTIRAFSGYGVCHEKFIWDVRMEPGVQDAFGNISGTSELLSSSDDLSDDLIMALPSRLDLAAKAGWKHVDQSPLKRGLQCVQGIVNLAPCGPEDGGLVVYLGSHNLFAEFFDSQTHRQTFTLWSWAFIVACVGTYLVNHVGRKRMLLVSCVLMKIFIFVVGALTKGEPVLLLP
jgi:hypothetical protein